MRSIINQPALKLNLLLTHYPAIDNMPETSIPPPDAVVRPSKPVSEALLNEKVSFPSTTIQFLLPLLGHDNLWAN
jgi:hypothetical protein